MVKQSAYGEFHPSETKQSVSFDHTLKKETQDRLRGRSK